MHPSRGYTFSENPGRHRAERVLRGTMAVAQKLGVDAPRDHQAIIFECADARFRSIQISQDARVSRGDLGFISEDSASEPIQGDMISEGSIAVFVNAC